MPPHFRVQGLVEARAVAEHHLAALVFFLARWRDEQVEHFVLRPAFETETAIGFVAHARSFFYCGASQRAPSMANIRLKFPLTNVTLRFPAAAC